MKQIYVKTGDVIILGDKSGKVKDDALLLVDSGVKQFNSNGIEIVMYVEKD